MRITLVTSLCLLLSLSALSQNEVDALRYSYLMNGGSARSMASGGAFGALGADMSVLHYNPAGIGRFRYSELGMSFGGTHQETAAQYVGMTTENSSFRPNFNQLGMVGAFAINKNNELSKWKRFQFGFSYTKLADYKENVRVLGENVNSSMLQVFTQQAYGVNENSIYDNYPFGAGLAYMTYAIDPQVDGSYSHRFEGETVTQMKSIERKGRLSESAISLGGNWNEKLYLGASVGIIAAKFQEQGIYTEKTDLSDTVADLIDFTYRDDLITSGSGINIKAGAIVLPAEWLRFGIAVHSPSVIQFKDNYSTTFSTFWWDDTTLSMSSPDGAFDYIVKTPGRLIGSAALVSKFGLISFDYERVNYAGARLRTPQFSESNYDFKTENETIIDIYRVAENYRIGVEFKVKEIIALRGGYALFGSPFKDKSGMQTQIFSLGLGYRWKIYYADLSVQHISRQENYYMYDPDLVTAAVLDHTKVAVNLSLGLRFK